MKVVVAAVRPTPILCRRASGLASPTEVPASTLPTRGIAPVRANMASRSEVLPLWKGPTSAMHRGPRGLLTSCPIRRLLIWSSALDWVGARMLHLPPRFGKRETSLRCIVTEHSGSRTSSAKSREKLTIGRAPPLPSRPQFQAFEAGRDIQPDLALNAERLQRDRIVR